jgi:hypothetical protein
MLIDLPTGASGTLAGLCVPAEVAVIAAVAARPVGKVEKLFSSSLTLIKLECGFLGWYNICRQG